MIECNNVTIEYARTPVASDISFTAQTGEITVILGKNGCGKTTLLRAVSGYLPYRGSIAVDGSQVNRLSVSERSKLICVMPQMLRSPGITVSELVSFGRQPYTGITGILSQKDRQIVDTVIERTGLSDLAEKRLCRISGGELQKAYFALLLCQDTPNLLLDEPGSHLDASYMSNLSSFLRDEKNNNKTVLAVFHDINRAVDIADKLIVLQNGSIVFDGSSTEFCLSHTAEDVFGLKKYLCSDPDDNNKKYCYL